MPRTHHNEVSVRFGYVVKTVREKLALTQEDLAEKAGIPHLYQRYRARFAECGSNQHRTLSREPWRQSAGALQAK